MGYHRAGFEVTGVDFSPQPRYPFAFVQADALEYLARHGREYDVIHASPPCQRYSVATAPHRREAHPDLLGPTEEMLERIGRPWVVENVAGAPLRSWIQLCGLMWGLKVLRHRRFESSVLLPQPPHPSHAGIKIGRGGYCCVAGHGDPLGIRSGLTREERAEHRRSATWSAAMGISWMTRTGLAQAIPPAYTLYIGQCLRQLLAGDGLVVPYPQQVLPFGDSQVGVR